MQNKNKHSNKKIKVFEAYPILICIATLFIYIGYAEISGVTLNISGVLKPETQQGVFISEMNNINETSVDSKINFTVGTMFEGKIVLDNNINDSETYEVILYNNSNIPHVFIGALTNIENDTLYDNNEIEYKINGLEEYKTIIQPNQTLNFTIDFNYIENATLINNILNCKLNFRFKELPKLILSNEGETYELKDIYPNFYPMQYTFSVKNFEEELLNTVPLTYSFDVTIDKPLNAKIYDLANNEVTGPINIGNLIQEEHQYILKIWWDDSNPEENIKYNSSKYEEMQFDCTVELVAQTNDEKYLDFAIKKAFNVNISSNDYKDSYDITYTDIPNTNDYPTEAADGENLTITFVNEIPVEIQVIGSDNYVYNRPTLTINNVKSDLEIVNATGELILFEQLESTVFAGNNFINTEVKMFNQANINRNFVISFEIENDDQTQATYGTLMSIMDESGSPYPGFLFRIGSSGHATEYELTANSVSGSGKAFYNPRATTQKVQIARIDGILYARVNDGFYERMQDYTNFQNYFDVPVTFGSALNASQKPFRFFKGTLSNMVIKVLYNKALENLPFNTTEGRNIENTDMQNFENQIDSETNEETLVEEKNTLNMEQGVLNTAVIEENI